MKYESHKLNFTESVTPAKPLCSMGAGDVVDADYRCFCAPGNWLSERSILAANPLRRR